MITSEQLQIMSKQYGQIRAHRMTPAELKKELIKACKNDDRDKAFRALVIYASSTGAISDPGRELRGWLDEVGR